jgi:hypothetical protein
VPQSTPTSLVPFVSVTGVVTVAQSSQLAVAGRVRVVTSLPFTVTSIVRGAGPPSAPT